jgi:hypothetical protein
LNAAKTVRTIEEINAELSRIWNNQFGTESAAYAPVPYELPAPGSIVFVGMNPSFSIKGWKYLLRLAKRGDIDPNDFFRWPSPLDLDVDLARGLEALAREHYSFFAPHRALAGALSRKDVHHLDLFAYRETVQSKAKELLVNDDDEVTLTDFGRHQFDLFVEVLSLAKPEVVIVINALASQIYRKLRDPEFDTADGTYRDSLSDHSFPVFFSGMLTGIRALDRFSKDRLFWQVAKALGRPLAPAA